MVILTDTEIFEEAFYARGGSLDTEQWSLLATVMNHHMERARRWIDSNRDLQEAWPPVYIDYIANPRVGGWAFEVRGRGFIGITGGAIGLLFLVFRRMLADPAIMPSIGDISVERVDMPPLVGEPAELYSLYSDPTSWFEPIDADRRRVSVNLIETAFDFLVAHEHAHIALGHSLLRRQLTGSAFISELGWDESEGMDDLSAQAMEIDADSRATLSGLGTMLRRLDHPESVHAEFSPLYNDPIEALYRWLFAVFTFFRLFGTRRMDLDDLGRGEHPHYRIRQRGILAYASSYLEAMRPELGTSLMTVAQRALVDVEVAYSKITNTDRETEALTAAFTDPRVMDHMRTVLERGREIMPTLDGLTQSRMSQA